MTEKQKRFCDEYLIDLNGTRAYKAAYPKVKNDNAAHACASKLLRNATIRAYLDERLEQLHNERTADAAELLGKRFGLFTDKVTVSGSGVVQIVDDIPDG